MRPKIRCDGESIVLLQNFLDLNSALVGRRFRVALVDHAQLLLWSSKRRVGSNNETMPFGCSGC
jgi:hypothetical protein